ncbi:hypothetical protein AAHA92_08944 [Salvia divinorum]|uniref:Uncharacterized protein n=1 Tax=Salvia divinorum TaxID=28513 RepID=A0ABD1HR81_SALDI
MKMNEILNIEDVNNCSLFDVVGVVQQCVKFVDESHSKLLELVLEDENHVSIHCTLWDGTNCFGPILQAYIIQW